jgi:hypothetical protein
LCSAIRFEVEGPIRGIGQCHCSLCRKSSGVNGSMVFLIPAERFRWTQGEDQIRTWKLRGTYSSIRCATCSSPMPASFDGKHFWVPPGLMDDDLDAIVALHHHVASKADWDRIPEDLPHFDAYPPAEVVLGDE